MLKQKEVEDAQTALIAWFKSQGISPFEGAQIMVGLMAQQMVAKQMVAKTTDIDKLQTAVDGLKDLLSLEVALLVKEELKK